MIDLKIRIDKNGSIGTDFNKKVKITGHEGPLSRIQAPTYRVCADDGSATCEVKRHTFSNLPFFTIDFLDGEPSVKLSQEMSEFKICYSIQGRGLSFSGDFAKGEIEVFQKQRSLGSLKAHAAENDLTVDIRANSEDCAVMTGVGLAYGLMLAYLLRPSHAADKS